MSDFFKELNDRHRGNHVSESLVVVCSEIVYHWDVHRHGAEVLIEVRFGGQAPDPDFNKDRVLIWVCPTKLSILEITNG
jgi:hypothetical protein